jgi:hypothetical protein
MQGQIESSVVFANVSRSLATCPETYRILSADAVAGVHEEHRPRCVTCPVMQECNAPALLPTARCVPKFCRRNIWPTCRECGTGEGHMHNCIGRRAAIAGVDRMAVEDVMASVLHSLPNEGALVRRCRAAVDLAMRPANASPSASVRTPADPAQMSGTTHCALRMGRAITRVIKNIVPTLAGRGAGELPTMLGQFVGCRI